MAPGEFTAVPAEPQRRAPPPPRPPVSVGTPAAGASRGPPPPGHPPAPTPSPWDLIARSCSLCSKDAHGSFAGGGAGLGCGWGRGEGSRTLDSPLSQCTLGIYLPARKKLGSFSANPNYLISGTNRRLRSGSQERSFSIFTII